MLAKNVMQRKVITAGPEMTIKELASLFVERQISGAPVVDSAGILVGVISQTDITRLESERPRKDRTPWFYLQTDEYGRRLKMEAPGWSARVKDYMTPIVISCGRDDTIEDAARMMLDQKLHRIVVAEDGKLFGIITTTDLLRAFLAGSGRRRTVARR